MWNLFVLKKRPLLSLSALLLLVPILIYLATTNAFSQPQNSKLPGSGPVTNKDEAIKIAQRIAINSQAEGSQREHTTFPKFQSVAEIASSDLQNILSRTGITTTDLDEHTTTAQRGIWHVTFAGAFSPKRGPSNVPTSTFLTTELFLDAQNGSVIHLQMHD